MTIIEMKFIRPMMREKVILRAFRLFPFRCFQLIRQDTHPATVRFAHSFALGTGSDCRASSILSLRCSDPWASSLRSFPSSGRRSPPASTLLCSGLHIVYDLEYRDTDRTSQ